MRRERSSSCLAMVRSKQAFEGPEPSTHDQAEHDGETVGIAGEALSTATLPGVVQRLPPDARDRGSAAQRPAQYLQYK